MCVCVRHSINKMNILLKEFGIGSIVFLKGINSDEYFHDPKTVSIIFLIYHCVRNCFFNGESVYFHSKNYLFYSGSFIAN